MRLSSVKLNKNIHKQIQDILYQTITDLKNPREVKLFLDDFLTKTENLALAKRLGVVVFLDNKRPYENIKGTLKVSSATIASYYKKLADPGVQLALQKVKAEAWANEWSQKINQLIKRFSS